MHDILGVSGFLIVFSAIIFFAPEFGGYFLEYNNFIPADPLKTPAHIAPVWYFTPFYSMLRAITSEMMYALIACVLAGAFLGVTKAKLAGLLKAVVVGGAVVLVALMLSIDAKFWGVVVMGGAVIILFFLPWLDNCAVKSIRYRPDWHKYLYGIFVINFVILAYLVGLPLFAVLYVRLVQARLWAAVATSTVVVNPEELAAVLASSRGAGSGLQEGLADALDVGGALQIGL